MNQKEIEQFIAEDGLERLQKSSQNFMRLMAYYRCAMMEIETKFHVLDQEFSLRFDRNPINSIKSRLKKVVSIKDKMEKKGQPMTAEAIEKTLHDIAGVRVVCSFLDDVYLLADALLKQDDITLIEKKDYIQNPKPNGYRSLHLIVSVPIFLAEEKRPMQVEIQLRTIAMDCWASLEHQLKYKKSFAFTEEMMQELHRCAVLSTELDDRMDKLRKSARE